MTATTNLEARVMITNVRDISVSAVVVVVVHKRKERAIHQYHFLFLYFLSFFFFPSPHCQGPERVKWGRAVLAP